MRTNGKWTYRTKLAFVAALGLAAEMTILFAFRRHFWLSLVLAVIPAAAGFAAINEWNWQSRIAALLAETRDRVITLDDLDKGGRYCLLARSFYFEKKAHPAPSVYGLPQVYLWDEPVEVPLVKQVASRIQVVGLQNRQAVRRLAQVRTVACDDSHWESAFEALARQAVIVVVDSVLVSPGVEKELEILSTIGALSKTVLISGSGDNTLPRQPASYPAERTKWTLSAEAIDGALTNETIGDILNFIDLSLAN